jgi:uncharacterized phage protein (TIGR02218 family)
MASFIERDLATIALCWRLERRDGVALGFTTHDRDLAIGGLIYRAAPGMLPSAITLSDGFDAETLDVEGALTSDAIRGEDLRMGRWDGAAVFVFMVDWENLSGETLPVARGELGEVTINGSGFEAALKGPAAVFDLAVVEQTSPECRAMLGDRRCRIDMAPRTRLTRISAVIAPDVVEVATAAAGNAYGYGRLCWISGAGSGTESAILRSDGTRLTLRDVPDSVPEAGDLVEIREGCDKSLATCSSRFANAANFRGEPHLPGMDLLTRYPGA